MQDEFIFNYVWFIEWWNIFTSHQGREFWDVSIEMYDLSSYFRVFVRSLPDAFTKTV